MQRDAVQPGHQRLADGAGVAGQGEEGLLGGVLRAHLVAQDAQAGAVDQAGMPAGDLREGLRVTVPGVARQQADIVHDQESRRPDGLCSLLAQAEPAPVDDCHVAKSCSQGGRGQRAPALLRRRALRRAQEQPGAGAA